MYKLILHKNLRSKNYTQEELEENFERTFELIDLTAETNRGNFLKELLRLREVIADIYVHRKKIPDAAHSLLKIIYATLISLDKEAFALLM